MGKRSRTILAGARQRAGAYRPRRSGRWEVLVALLGIVLAAFCGVLAYFMPAVLTAVRATGQVVSIPSPPAAAPTPVSPASGQAFTVLLLGSDDDQKFDPKHVLTQSMILVRIDPASSQVTMLSIPRDLWVPVSSGGSAKIDAAYSDGGPSAAIATVQQNFHVHIDEYVWIGLLGLIKLIDRLGGIDIVASNPVMDDYYPADINSSNPYGYERVAVMPGPQHLDGTTALQYVRSRHSDLEGDFARSQRQQQVLLAVRAKARQLSTADLPDIAASLSGELKTSMSLEKVTQLLPLAGKIDDPSAIHQIVLLSPYTSLGWVGDQSVVFANWNLVLPLVRQYFP